MISYLSASSTTNTADTTDHQRGGEGVARTYPSRFSSEYHCEEETHEWD